MKLLQKRVWMVILIMAVVGLGACASPTPTPTPTPTPVPPTATPVPTDTPEPTNTPAPTNTVVPTDTPEPVSEGMPLAADKVRSEMGGVAIAYPEDWEAMELFGMIVIAPSEDAFEGGMMDSTAVMLMGASSEDLAEEDIESLDDIEDDLDKLVGQAAEGMEIVSSERIKLANEEAVSVAFTGIDEQTEQEVAGRALLSLFEDRAVVIMGAGPAADWADFEPTFDAMLETIEFFEPTEDVDLGGLTEPIEDNWVMNLGEVQDGTELVSESHYIDFVGNLWVAAEIRNLTDQALGQPQAILHVGEFSQDYGTTLNKLAPGETAPIMLLASADEIPEGAIEYTLDVGAMELDDFSAEYYYYDFAVENDELTAGEFAEQGVAGELVNTGDSAAEFVRALVAFYDAEGTILYVNDAYIEEEVLAPGARASFLVDMMDAAGIAASYQVWVEGNKSDEAAADTTEAAADTTTATEETSAIPASGEAMPLAAEPVRSEAGGVAIAYPEGWEAMEMFGFVVIAENENAFQADMPDSAVVMLMSMTSEDLAQEGLASLDDIEADLGKVVGQTSEGMTIVSSERIKLGGEDAVSAEYEGTDPESDAKVAGQVLMALVDDRAVMIMGMAPGDAWNNFAATFDAMLETVEFFEPTEEGGLGEVIEEVEEAAGQMETEPGEYDSPFPLPNDVQSFMGTPEMANFQTTLTVDELVEYYRAAFADQGLTERAANTVIDETMFSMVFDGSPNGRAVVIQVVDLGETRNVNIRYEDV